LEIGSLTEGLRLLIENVTLLLNLKRIKNMLLLPWLQKMLQHNQLMCNLLFPTKTNRCRLELLMLI
jgi:hypothetical protein